MGLLQVWKNKWLRWRHRRPLSVWYSPLYRFPLTQADIPPGLELRRADFAIWYLLEQGVISLEETREASRIRYREIARVHTCSYLESLTRPAVLGRIFAVDEAVVPVDEILRSIRVACGGTLEAAREALREKRNTLNLLGGFHHASPSSGGGFCVVNDIAVAIEVLRDEGFHGQIAILDLDAHPPDGLADCLREDLDVWIGSLSGADWGELRGVDETVLPKGADDALYLDALSKLLERMPRAALAFVIAGGDVLAGDKLGLLGLSLAGARQRDLMVCRALDQTPSVWIPGGGYHADAWKVLAGSALALALGSTQPIPPSYDPLRARFLGIAQKISREDLEGEDWFTDEDVASILGLPTPTQKRLLDFYTEEGIEYALFRYGLTDQVRRLGYGHPRIAIDANAIGDRLRIFAEADGIEHMIAELVVEKKKLDDLEVLYIHWLTLRHGKAEFAAERPQLPGQEKPGLGLAREVGEMLLRMADRLHLQGVALRPSWYHIAYAMRADFRFYDPARQGRFEALIRDLAHIPLREATEIVAKGHLLMNGQPYRWEADTMVYWLDAQRYDTAATQAEKERVTFTPSLPQDAPPPLPKPP